VEAGRGETEVVLRVDLDADPITGSLGSAGGPSRRFSGRIELVAALQAARAEGTQRPQPAPEDGAG
jgi:hypothetical protein